MTATKSKDNSETKEIKTTAVQNTIKYNMCVSMRAVLIVQYDCCREERPAVALCHTPGVSQPIAEGAAQ